MFAYKNQNDYTKSYIDFVNRKKTASNYVEEVIELGMELLADNNLSSEQLDVWLVYTEEVLTTVVKTVVSNVVVEFLALKLKIQFRNELEPFRKIYIYIGFLIEVNKLLNKEE